MNSSRRNFLAGGGAFAIGFPAKYAHAELSLGEIRLDVVSDGSLTLPGDFLFEPMPKDELAPILNKYKISAEVVEPQCNVTLMRQGDRTVLFDVGSGSDFAPNAGKLLDSLEALGVAPDDVTDVVFTHAHPDHLWGLLDDFDDLMFVNATYLIGTAEWDYWTAPSTVDTIGDARMSFAIGAKRRLEMIKDKIALINDGDEIMHGVMARATFGHTPGHMAFEIRHGTESALILGDCIGNHHVAFEKPEWYSGSDQDQKKAARTRVKLMDQLAAEKIRIIGFHLPGNGIGYVDKTASGYTFVAEDAL